jgi:hypothetical protein
MHMLLGDMLVCLINVMNDFNCLWYIHTTKKIKFQPKKLKVIWVQKGQVQNPV